MPSKTFDAMMLERAEGDFFSADNPEDLERAAVENQVSSAIKSKMAELLKNHMRSIERGDDGWFENELWYREYVALARGLREWGVDSGSTVYQRATYRLEAEAAEAQ